MLDQNRQLQLFRAMVKEQLRLKGIRLTGSFSREVSSEVKKLNERLSLDPPLMDAEFIELYLRLARELFEEHYEMLVAKFLGGTDPAPRTNPASTGGGMPG